MGDSPAGRVLAWWLRLRGLPGGSWLFSRLLGWWIPYTGTIRPHVRELRPGYARITLGDRRGIRNHLSSIHAVALVNLGEITSGLALVIALPPGIRSIPTGLTAEFLKKGRGLLTATSASQVPQRILESTETVVVAEISDRSGDIVARVRVTWRLSPPQS